MQVVFYLHDYVYWRIYTTYILWLWEIKCVSYILCVVFFYNNFFQFTKTHPIKSSRLRLEITSSVGIHRYFSSHKLDNDRQPVDNSISFSNNVMLSWSSSQFLGKHTYQYLSSEYASWLMIDRCHLHNLGLDVFKGGA